MAVTRDLAPGTRVRIEILSARPRVGDTRQTVRVSRGVVVGPVQYEPGMLRVRVDGQVVRLLCEYLTEEVS